MISPEETRHIANLSRIGISEKEIEKLSGDLSAILDWMAELKKIEIEKTEPTAHITGLENVAREDKDFKFENVKGIVKLFPEEKNGYDKVKSVM